MTGDITKRDTFYKLEHKIKFANAGQLRSCSKILLREPTSQHAQYYMRIKQMLTKAQIDASSMDRDNQAGEQPVGGVNITNQQPSQPQDDILGDSDLLRTVISVSLFQSNRVDMGEFHAEFGRMLAANTDTSIAACVDDEDETVIRMKIGDWRGMHPDDQIDMAIAWCAFFSMPSLLRSLGSETQSESALTAAGA